MVFPHVPRKHRHQEACSETKELVCSVKPHCHVRSIPRWIDSNQGYKEFQLSVKSTSMFHFRIKSSSTLDNTMYECVTVKDIILCLETVSVD